MGDKIESKRIAKEAAVNVIPGFDGVVKVSGTFRIGLLEGKRCVVTLQCAPRVVMTYELSGSQVCVCACVCVCMCR